MDQTAWFWDAALQRAQLQGLSQERLTKLKSAQILRSLAGKSVFQSAAVEVARNINALRDFVKERQRDYVQPGRCTPAERDKIEEQVGLYVRSCTANIQKLEASISRAEDLSPHCNAHRHGVALILSERLQGISKAFDQCRSIRYQQLMAQQKQQQHRRREVLQAKEHNTAAMQSSHSAWSAQHTDSGPGGSQVQAQIEAENRALQEELQSLGQQVASTEASMRELAMLTQMFSTQVFHQSEQTRQLYQQAVEATEFIQKGNVQLQKAIRLNSSTRLYIFCFLLMASLLLLFFDWWSS